MSSKIARFIVLGIVFLVLAFVATSTVGVPRANAAPAFAADRFLVQAKSSADLAALTESINRSGGQVIGTLPQLKLLIVNGKGKLAANTLAAESTVAHVARDGIKSLIRPEQQADLWGKAFTTERKLNKIKVNAPTNQEKTAAPPSFVPDPSYGLSQTMWSQLRVGAFEAWGEKGGAGVSAVTVGVADTGLDYTHVDLADNVIHVQDFTYLEEPYVICRDFVQDGFTDQDLADAFGGPADGDWNGHGSWIGGNIAGVVNETGMNGIAPNVKLVALKISQWCGSAFDSEIIAAILYAADNGIDVVNISFGGYLDRSDPQQDFIWHQYRDAVKYATTKGTIIASSAGNDHVRIGKRGKVISHGILTPPGGSSASDYYGLYETPAGIPGVLMVSATNDSAAPPSPSCNSADSDKNNATCKPESDAHQPFGLGRANQLAYYSNYGRRVNFAAPGGARKFNLPVWDRGGTPGFPYTDADGTRVWESFSVTSNWALEIPCFDLSSIPGFTADCYTSIQGTSMAGPHVAAVLAQIASARPDLRKVPKALKEVLKAGTFMPLRNMTPPLSATDTSNTDLTDLPCDSGYCHLGGAPISNREAYGAGIVNGYDSIK